MNFFVWFGRKGFMRGPVWSFLLLIAWVVLFGTIQTITRAETSVASTTIAALIVSALYLLAYYFLPKLLHKNY